MTFKASFTVPASIFPVIVAAGLRKLDECRANCPGIGGDVDAMNLRHILEHPTVIDKFVLDAVSQAATSLKKLSHSLNIQADNEIAAMAWVSESLPE